MLRSTLTLTCLVATLALAGCGRGAAPLAAGAVAGSAQAQSFLHFKAPHDRLLTSGEQNGDFDRDRALATHESTAWDPSPKLVWAWHSPARPGENGTVVPARFAFSYTAGIDSLVTMVAPQTVTFHQKPHLLEGLIVGTIDSNRLVSGADALAAARTSGKIKTEDPCVLLIRYHTQKDAFYTFVDSKSAATTDAGTAAKTGNVTVDAYTGKLVTDQKLAAEAAQALDAVGAEAETDAR